MNDPEKTFIKVFKKNKSQIELYKTKKDNIVEILTIDLSFK
jgi:hypothetical protein